MNRLLLRLPRSFLPFQVRPYSSLPNARPTAVPTFVSAFHSVGRLASRKRDNFSFSSKAPLLHKQDEPKGEDKQQNAKRKTRSSAAKNSLRRVAVEAQRSRDGKGPKKPSVTPLQITSKASMLLPQTVTAVCAAEEYDIAEVARILQRLGHALDPFKTELHDQVVHVSLPVQANIASWEGNKWALGDLFIFPSGTVVAWAVPDNVLSGMVSQTLLPAANNPLSTYEEEDLEFIEDPNKENSSIRGDRIVLGTKPQSRRITEKAEPEITQAVEDEPDETQSRSLDTVLAKIAFSSGLARSTKLAVLESLLGDYFESTKSIPAELSRGGRMPFSRNFISQKTGQLLGIRAQLNLYSELTDSLPDLFWDSRHELGLEGYYDQVGKALDTNIRIKVLNEKMDYAQEIASVLRQHLSEVHGVRLEWIIIVLIAVEVIFAIRNEIKDYIERKATETEQPENKGT